MTDITDILQGSVVSQKMWWDL